MESAEINDKINLNDIATLSDEDFKTQIAAWIEEHGFSRVLQAKLRTDLFEQFNRTNLGRRIAEQHQQTHRIVLSPLILVLNTLVAEFLYAEDCHFTLSVFATEVPYKNTLPNFEATPRLQVFRFTDNELNDIFEAVGLTKQNEEFIRDFYIKCGVSEQKDMRNKSLLYCIFKTVISQIASTEPKHKKDIKNVNPKPKRSSTPIVSSSSQSSLIKFSPARQKCSSCLSSRIKHEKYEVSSRYFKYLNRYLDILSERVREMSKSLAEKNVHKPQKKTTDSSAQESSLKKDLNQIIENLNRLSKSKQKNKRFQDILNSIERLSASLEKCSDNLENVFSNNFIKPSLADAPAVAPSKIGAKADRLSDMDYVSWLQELKTSENGKKFIDRLEISLQKTMEKERENLEKLYDEKMNNYRMLVKLHYKQKYGINQRTEGEAINKAVASEFNAFEKEMDEKAEKVLNDVLISRAHEKEQHVDQIVRSAKIRLQQLERESEHLDESFQAYLQRQQSAKIQLKQDVSKIWENYNLEKAALVQYSPSVEQANVLTNQSKLVQTRDIDSALKDTIKEDAEIQDFLKDLHKIKPFESPFKNLSINDILDKRKVTISQAASKVSTAIQERVGKIFESKAPKQVKIVEDKNYLYESQIPAKISDASNSSSSAESEINRIMNEDPVLNAYILPKTIEKSVPNPITTTVAEKELQIEAVEVKNKENHNSLKPIPRNNGLTNGHKAEIDEKNTNEMKAPHSEDPKESAVQQSREVDDIVAVKESPEKSLPNVESQKLTNGYATKSTEVVIRPSAFITKISSTESEMDDSPQISIGPTQDTKSPDFWI